MRIVSPYIPTLIRFCVMFITNQTLSLLPLQRLRLISFFIIISYISPLVYFYIGFRVNRTLKPLPLKRLRLINNLLVYFELRGEEK